MQCHLAATAVIMALLTTAVAETISVQPTPQRVVTHGGKVALSGWPVATDDQSATATAKLLAGLTQSQVGSGIAALPATKFIAVGLLGSRAAGAV